MAIYANVTSDHIITLQNVVYRNICRASLPMKPTIRHIDLTSTNALIHIFTTSCLL